MSKKFWMYEVASWLCIYGNVYSSSKRRPFDGAVCLMVLVGIVFEQGKIVANQKMQETVDKMVWVKVEKALGTKEKT